MSTPEALCVVTRITGRRAVVTLAGEVGLPNGPRLRAAVDVALGSGAHLIEVDFTGVSFCDCSGLSVLIDGRKKARKADVGFGVSHAEAPVVKRLFALAGADDLLLTETAAA
ncbi:STAS domain-containing protein [Streptomyces sp. NPDC054887]